MISFGQSMSLKHIRCKYVMGKAVKVLTLQMYVGN